MQKMHPRPSDIRALFINCSLKRTREESHTQTLMDRLIFIMETEGVTVEQLHAREYDIAFGMIKDASVEGRTDAWPALQEKIMDADILVLGTPIWLGVKSSIATLVIERMYAYSGDTNSKGQFPYYGKVGGCVITGNEDGIKHCAMDILYALQHIGFTVPPQADCGWIGEVGPGPSYGDITDGENNTPTGFDNEFTNRNATFTAWNLMHLTRLLKDNGGIPAIGNTADGWRNVTNAARTPI